MDDQKRKYIIKVFPSELIYFLFLKKFSATFYN